jgi:hypothetical protein
MLLGLDIASVLVEEYGPVGLLLIVLGRASTSQVEQM